MRKIVAAFLLSVLMCGVTFAENPKIANTLVFDSEAILDGVTEYSSEFTGGNLRLNGYFSAYVLVADGTSVTIKYQVYDSVTGWITPAEADDVCTALTVVAGTEAYSFSPILGDRMRLAATATGNITLTVRVKTQ